MKRHPVAVTCALCLLVAPTVLAASGPGAPEKATVNPSYPVREMTMNNVRHIFGAPERVLAPVPTTGSDHKPPITRWIYPGFIVYFERNLVIHTVLTHPRRAPTPATR